MSKLWLIIQREYFTRVRKRSFILATLLAPMGILIYVLVIGWLTRYQGGDEVRVALLDEGKMVGTLPDEKGVRFIPAGSKTLEQLKQEVAEKKLDGVVRVPALTNLATKEITIFYYSDEKLAPEKSRKIERRIAGKIRDFKIDSLGYERKSLEGLETEVSIDPESISGKSDNQSKYSAGVGIGLGFVMAFLMFFMVIMYGNLVMRSVMEEKTNRIVEVMMSSVKPFQLMLGKIIGAGGVGLTQVVIWVVLSWGISLLTPFLVDIDPQALADSQQMGANAAQQIDPEQAEDFLSKIWVELSRQNWGLMVFSFIVFFLGGYFIYASLFAAIGSAMSDDLGEGQALTLPVTIPIILAFYIVTMAGMRNPDSGLMVFASIFPLFSPIVMPFRMAFNPPMWQVALSLVLVVLSAFFFVWLAGRIYRVGILLYGKKVTLKELGKWMFYRG